MNELFMHRALELAAKGKGHTCPNPLVGCVIVHKGSIIGEGWHQAFGGPHAEVNAINSVIDKNRLSESSVYVNLEPCVHFGKTPPCVALLIQHQVKKVFIGNVDPHPLVQGRGVQKLKAAGIEVVVGVLKKEGEALNRSFFTFAQKKRPYILLKWAETADGFMAQKNYATPWISNELSTMLVHQWRSEEDAILVGSNTALYDNPQLSVRHWSGKHPLRLLIDRQLRLPTSLHLFDQSQPTLCYNCRKAKKLLNLEYVKLLEKNFLASLLKDLYKRKIQSLIVEGGSRLLHEFIQQGSWDEARVFVSDKKFVEGLPAPSLKCKPQVVERILNDKLMLFYNTRLLQN